MSELIKTTDKRRLRGEESRRLILQAAVDCIASEGLGRLTLDRVAGRVGISRGLVVFHFKSKQKLVEEVLHYLGMQYSGPWYEIVEEKGEAAVSKLLRLIDYDIRFASEHPNYVSAWHAFWGDARANQLFHEQGTPRDEAYTSDMASLLEKISDAGGYDKQDLPMITRGLVAMMFGTWTQLHLNPGADDYKVNMDAVHFFLRKMFPDTPFPARVRD
jgi:TetR/AcrR family transcriptional repressor of bet genes